MRSTRLSSWFSISLLDEEVDALEDWPFLVLSRSAAWVWIDGSISISRAISPSKPLFNSFLRFCSRSFFRSERLILADCAGARSPTEQLLDEGGNLAGWT